MKRVGYILFMGFVVMILSCNVLADEEYMTESGEIRQVEDGEVMTDSGQLEEVGPGGEYMTDSGEIREVSESEAMSNLSIW